jgi:hypothetical protein
MREKLFAYFRPNFRGKSTPDSVNFFYNCRDLIEHFPDDMSELFSDADKGF